MSDVKKELMKEGPVLQEQEIEEIPESKKGLLAWVKLHKNQLVLAGISVTTIVGIIWGIKNKDALAKLWASFAESVKKVPSSSPSSMSTSSVEIPAPIHNAVLQTRAYTPPTEAFGVSRHIRTMATGKHHSAAKAAEAATLGIDLLPNQTLVGPYTKCAA